MALMAPAGGEDTTKTMVTSAAGYNCFTDVSGGGNQSLQSQVVNQFHQGFDFNPAEIYGLTSGMELLGFPPKNMQQEVTTHHHDSNSVMWKELFGKSVGGGGGGGGGASTSKAINDDQDQFYHQDFSHGTLMGGGNQDDDESAVAWHNHHQDNRVQLLDHDPTAMRSSCVFPCEGNERPSQGLSLSLGSSDHPSRIGLQSFELRQPDHDIRFGPRGEGFFGKSTMNIQHQQQQNLMQDRGILGKVGNLHFHQNQFQIRSSKYLNPAQELLNEFCNLGTKHMADSSTPRLKIHKTNQSEDQENASNTSSRMQSLYSTDLLELQKRKAKLLQMLEEVDRRYKHYCDQMKAVVSSFEAVAGNGAATVYSSLASKAMSRHFRSLRDGIINEIKATKKALGEKDAISPGGTRGETPRLRLLDQSLRQQRAFQQMSMMETHPWRPQRGLPERAVSVLRAWLFEHFLHPYPSEVDKHILARQTGLSRSQVSNWFINARVRLWKPMVEEMYVEETKEQENMGSTSDTTDKNIGGAVAVVGGTGRPNIISKMDEDLKPTHEQLVRIDSECLSSIIHNNPADKIHADDDDDEHVDHHNQHIMQHHNNMNSYTFGAVDVDFSSSYNHAYGGGGAVGGVSLTLGLQQHGDGGGAGGGGGGAGGGGVSLAFSPSTNHHQNSVFYTREHIENCPPGAAAVQYSSLLDSESQNLPYRNLMGAQLLHDLAG